MCVIISFHIQNINYRFLLKHIKLIFKYMLNNVMINRIHKNIFELKQYNK